MRPSWTAAPYGSQVQPPPGGTTSPCALRATIGPAPKRWRTTRFVIERNPAAPTVAAGTSWRSTSNPMAESKAAARCACGVLSPGGVSLGTFTSSARNATASACRASSQRSRSVLSVVMRGSRDSASGHGFEAKTSDAADLLQRGRELGLARLPQARLDAFDDDRPVEPFHGNDEGEAEFLPVSLVERLHAGLLRGGASVEARGSLLRTRAPGEPGRFQLAQELGMRANEYELLVARGAVQRALHRRVQRIQRGERPRDEGPFGNPRGMLVDGAQACDEIGLRQAVQGLQRDHADGLRNGCRAIQWRAISTRRQIQTRSWRWTWSRNRASEARRPGPPARRQCSPIDSIFGVSAPSAYSVSKASRR